MPAIAGLANDDVPTKSKTWSWGSGQETVQFRHVIDQNPDGVPTGGYNDTTTAMQSDGDGTHYLHVQATDDAGNESGVVTVHGVLDNTAPVVTGLSDDPGPVQNKIWTWDADDADNVITYRYLIDQDVGGVPTGAYGDVTTASKADADGTWYIHAQARDRAGNESGVATVSVLLDNTGFDVAVTVGVASPTNASPITFTMQFSEDAMGFVSDDVTLTGNATKGLFTVVDADTYTLEVTPIGNGQIEVTVPADSATDAAGNGNTYGSATVVHDITVPTVTVTVPVTAIEVDTATYQIKGTASGGDGSGIAEVEVNVNGAGWQLATGTASWTYNAPLTIGPNTVLVRARNLASTLSAEVPVPTITRIDGHRPVISVDPPEVYLVVGATVPDALEGVAATDEQDGDLPGDAIAVSGDTVDTETEGDCIVFYDVTDSDGNAALQQQRVYRVARAIASVGDCKSVAGKNLEITIDLACPDLQEMIVGLSYDPAVLQYVDGGETVNPERAPDGLEVNDQNGTVYLSAFAIRSDITKVKSGTGELARLTFSVVGATGDVSALTFSTLTLNDVASLPVNALGDAGQLQVIAFSLDIDEDEQILPGRDILYIYRALLIGDLPLPIVPASHRAATPDLPDDTVIKANVQIGADSGLLDIDGDGELLPGRDILYLYRALLIGDLPLPIIPASHREATPELPNDSVIRERARDLQ